MTQVARAKPVTPAGKPEQCLLEAVDLGFSTIAAFCRAVAERTGKTPAAEETAFYRIVRGYTGSKTAWRIRTYAEILNADPAMFLRDAELPQPEVPDSSLAARLEEAEAALNALAPQVAKLARRVRTLERQAQTRTPPAVAEERQ